MKAGWVPHLESSQIQTPNTVEEYGSTFSEMAGVFPLKIMGPEQIDEGLCGVTELLKVRRFKENELETE